MVSNTGTYIDCPFHRFRNGRDLGETDLERFVDLPDRRRPRASSRAHRNHDDGISFASTCKGKAVLVDTGWSEHWSTPAYFDNHPFLTADAATFLRNAGALLVGIDSHNIDDTRTKNSRPVHTTLLDAEVLIVEHLRGLEQLPLEGFTFTRRAAEAQRRRDVSRARVRDCRLERVTGRTVICVAAVVRRDARILLVRQAAGHSLDGQWTRSLGAPRRRQNRRRPRQSVRPARKPASKRRSRVCWVCRNCRHRGRAGWRWPISADTSLARRRPTSSKPMRRSSSRRLSSRQLTETVEPWSRWLIEPWLRGTLSGRRDRHEPTASTTPSFLYSQRKNAALLRRSAAFSSNEKRLSKRDQFSLI